MTTKERLEYLAELQQEAVEACSRFISARDLKQPATPADIAICHISGLVQETRDRLLAMADTLDQKAKDLGGQENKEKKVRDLRTMTFYSDQIPLMIDVVETHLNNLCQSSDSTPDELYSDPEIKALQELLAQLKTYCEIPR
jgi:hypothetical protein